MKDQSYFSKKVTFFNVILTFFIVLLHAETPLRFGMPLDKSFPFIYSVFTIVQLGVPMFFLISAILFFKNCTFNELENKYTRRVYSLLIPYIVWNTFFVFVYVFLLHVPFIQERMHMNPNILSTPQKILGAIIHSKCTPLWFIKDLMLLTLLAPVVLLLCKDIRLLFVAFGISVLVAIYGEYNYENIIIWIPVYLQGAIISRVSFRKGYYRSFDIHVNNKYSKIICAVVLSSFLIWLYVSLYNEDKFIRVFRYIAPVLVWVLSDFILRGYLTSRFTVKPWMSYMFIIYCMHHFILNVLQKLVSLVFEPTQLVLNITFVITPMITVIIIVLLAKYMKRFKFYKYLSGGR